MRYEFDVSGLGGFVADTAEKLVRPVGPPRVRNLTGEQQSLVMDAAEDVLDSHNAFGTVASWRYLDLATADPRHGEHQR